MKRENGTKHASRSSLRVLLRRAPTARDEDEDMVEGLGSRGKGCAQEAGFRMFCVLFLVHGSWFWGLGFRIWG